MYTVGDLTKLFIEKGIGPSDCAHLCVDVQERSSVRGIARHIAQVITPAFRQACVRNYWIHLGDHPFCEVSPEPGEEIIRKRFASTFAHTSIDNSLKALIADAVLAADGIMIVSVGGSGHFDLDVAADRESFLPVESNGEVQRARRFFGVHARRQTQG